MTLQCFLYLLLRDDVVAGRVEELVRHAEKSGGNTKFSNEFLAAYAKELADRLTAIS